MQELTIANKMTSMQIAEVTGKQHCHITRDIKDEIEKLKKAGINTQSKFGLRERDGITGKIPYYELTKEGVLQLAARYDAVIRSKLIDLAMKNDQQYTNLSPELQAIIMHDRKIQAIESKVEKLENTMTIDYGQQETLRQMANIVVVHYLGGKESRAYKKLAPKAFSEFWNNYKAFMLVNSYKNTAVKDFDKAVDLIKGWKPNQRLALKIQLENTKEPQQLSVDDLFIKLFGKKLTAFS